jgi:hypothetical protein
MAIIKTAKYQLLTPLVSQRHHIVFSRPPVKRFHHNVSSTCPTLFVLLLRLDWTRSYANPQGQQLPLFSSFLQLERDKVTYVIYITISLRCYSLGR